MPSNSNSSPSPTMHDLMVTRYAHPSGRPCEECRGQLATVRVVVSRIERGGMLVTDRVRQTCDGCAGAVADMLHASAQFRLYGAQRNNSGEKGF